LQRGITGLGPPDLVCLQKSTSNQSSVQYYHFVSGLQISNTDSFLQYYRTLRAIRPRRAFGKPCYQMPHAEYSCFNSFTGIDLRIKIENKAISGASLHSLEGVTADIQPEAWRQVSLCSVLRYWIAPAPLFRAILNLEYRTSPALRLIAPPDLSDSDIDYVLEKHSPSQDLESALACFLLSHSGSRFELLLSKIIAVFPRVLVLVLKLAHINSPFILSQSESAYFRNPDDTSLAYTFAKCCIEAKSVDRALAVVPLLQTSMWSCPMACCVMAILCGQLGLTDDSLYCLNAACHAREYSKDVTPEVDTLAPLIQSHSGPASTVTVVEKEIVSSQICGLSYLLYRATIDLAVKISPNRFKMLLSDRFETESDDGQINPEFMGLNWPEPIDDDDLGCLYDEGVSGEVRIPDAIRRLPRSARFAQIADSVLDDLNYSEMIMNARQIEGPLEAQRIVLLAFRLENPDLCDFVSVQAKKWKQLGLLIDLMRAKLNRPRAWAKLTKKLDIAPKKLTVNEYNAMLLFRSLAPGMGLLLS
jgi:hypothetical protein